jgi:hypothetical protein
MTRMTLPSRRRVCAHGWAVSAIPQTTTDSEANRSGKGGDISYVDNCTKRQPAEREGY